MSTALVALKGRDIAWAPVQDPIVIGKDILELLSSSMYVDPLTIYREYVQNAADAIDDARDQGLLGKNERGTVDITITPEARTVQLRDNGIGIPASEFVHRLTSFGASKKRGTTARGFRGVGRLAGLGSCQELVFRSRAHGERTVSELRWDCKDLKALLRAADNTRDLTGTVAAVVTHRAIDGRPYPERFFEVELRGVIRHRNDQLMNPVAVGTYLAQVAPLPFSKDFPHADAITGHIRPHVRLGDLRITITGLPEPLTRPHAAGVVISPTENDPYADLELLTIPAVGGGAIAAIGWIAHHGYTGALPASANVRGLRIRAGNIQVGDERLLEELFPEVRFNAWAVGEIHVIDHRVIPNGRRDHFEQNVHYHNLITHLLPAAREIARRCRTSSQQRKWQRDFERGEQAIKEKMSVIRQGAVTKTARKRLLQEIQLTLSALAVVTQRDFANSDQNNALAARLENLRRSTTRLTKTKLEAPAIGNLSPRERQVIDLIFACSPNQAAAKLLVDKIVERLNASRPEKSQT